MYNIGLFKKPFRIFVNKCRMLMETTASSAVNHILPDHIVNYSSKNSRNFKITIFFSLFPFLSIGIIFPNPQKFIFFGLNNCQLSNCIWYNTIWLVALEIENYYYISIIIPGISSGFTNAFNAALSDSTGVERRVSSKTTCRIEIWQPGSGTGVLSTYCLHSRLAISLWFENNFYPLCSKARIYAENASYRSPYLKKLKLKTAA